LNYYDSDSEDDNNEILNSSENEIQKFQIDRRIRHLYNLFHMLLKDYRKTLIRNSNNYSNHIGDYLWILFEEVDISNIITNVNISKETIFTECNVIYLIYFII